MDKDGDIDFNVQIPSIMIVGLADMDGRTPTDRK
jgi:hypothetical protein